MSDERYVVRTERLADAHAAYAPVWRSRYDGEYTGIADDPGPEFARYADLLPRALDGAHGGDGAGIWLGGDGPAAALHEAWGAFTAKGDPGWPRYAPAGGHQAMIFTGDGPHVAANPFAHAREAWAGLEWQPGTWWPVGGVS
jgi:para-nitrobenzyl esterase